jgi:hypothetical protein
LNSFWDFKYGFPDLDIDIEYRLEYLGSGNRGYFFGRGVEWGGSMCKHYGGVWEDWEMGRGLVIEILYGGGV